MSTVQKSSHLKNKNSRSASEEPHSTPICDFLCNLPTKTQREFSIAWEVSNSELRFLVSDPINLETERR